MSRSKIRLKSFKYLRLLVFAEPTVLDTVLLVAGFVAATVSGVPFPLVGILFGQLIDDFNGAIDNSSVRHWRDCLDSPKVTVLDPELQVNATQASVLIENLVNVTTRAAGVTMATVATTACAVVLSRHAKIQDVVFGSVTSGRTIDLPDVENIVGPCYQYAPVRVKLDVTVTYSSLLNTVQHQQLREARYSGLGFE